MDEIIKEDVPAAVLPSETEEQKKIGDDFEAQGLNRDGSQKQDPLKTELERVQQPGRTKKEKLLYTKKRIEEQLKELGVEDDAEPDLEDDKPVTVGMLKKLQPGIVPKTAIELAEEIQDETERELTKYHIENTIRPTGDPKKDLALAQVHVNAVKNKQILDMVVKKPAPSPIPSNGGANPLNGKIEEELTPEEIPYTRPPFNMTKEAILKARPKA